MCVKYKKGEENIIMERLPKKLTLTVGSTILVVTLAACSAGTDTSPQTTNGGSVSTQTPPTTGGSLNENSSPAVIIDVRTPEEFTSGHLEGAVNINLQAPDFEEQINTLDKDGSYAVYCRSGNRSAEAVSLMKNVGFTDVEDHGSVQEASESLNTPVVR